MCVYYFSLEFSSSDIKWQENEAEQLHVYNLGFQFGHNKFYITVFLSSL